MTFTADRLRRSVLGIAAALAAMLAGAPGLAAAGADQIARASEALARGDGIAAEIALRRALDRGAPRAAVAAMMGEAYLDQDAPDKARDWLAPGIFTPESAAKGFRLLARLEMRQGDLPAAGRALDRAMAITPNDATMWVEIGRLRYAGGEHLLAIEAADHALELDRGNVRAIEFRGQIERDRAGLLAALPWFERALVVAPGDVGVMGEYAATLGEIGRTRDMLRVTRRMLELDPGNPRAFFLQAVMAARAGDYRLARGLLERTHDKLAEMPAAMLLRGALEMETGNHLLAMEVLQQLVRLQPANDRAALLLARAEFLAGEHRLLLADFGEAAARADASPYLLTLVGRAQEQLGRRDLAALLLDRAAIGAPPALSPIAQGSPVGALLAAGNFGEARATVDQSLAEMPGSAAAQEVAGDLALFAGQPAEAVAHYREVARVRLGDALMLRIAAAYRLAGDTAAEAAFVEGYLRQHPMNRAALRIAAGRAAAAGDWRRAWMLLESLRVRGGDGDALLLAELSLAQLRSGDAAAAELTGRAAWRLQRARPTGAAAWGLALAARGEQPRLAASLLDRARRQGLDDPMLAEARAKLAAR